MDMQNRDILFKALIIGALSFFLLIPTFLINNLVSERQQRQSEAFDEISSKWASAQTITGPVLSIPYTEYSKDANGVLRSIRKHIHLLPEQLDVAGTIIPEKRKRGLYEVAVYKSDLSLTGYFKDIENQTLGIPKNQILYQEAFISVGVSDLRGIEDRVDLFWDSDTLSFNSGIEATDLMTSGVNVGLKLDSIATTGLKHAFQFDLSLKGSRNLFFTPVGKESTLRLNSPWASPSFDGAFLPDSSQISDKGFDAYWKILHLNRNYPQSWLNNKYQFVDSEFGLNLLLPVDNYTQTDRSIKYAILFIALTFLIFFFLELVNKVSVHPLQYILIGFALALFYILLLSISEHLTFYLAYLISALMTLGLIGWYSSSILKQAKLSALIVANLIILYSFIFTIIQMESYALLMGSIGLFVILTIIMYFSRKIDWKSLNMSDGNT
jgi:inner membrane protein